MKVKKMSHIDTNKKLKGFKPLTGRPKYVVKNVTTGEEKDFYSRPAIADYYNNITVANLDYHFSKMKKEVVIIGFLMILNKNTD